MNVVKYIYVRLALENVTNQLKSDINSGVYPFFDKSKWNVSSADVLDSDLNDLYTSVPAMGLPDDPDGKAEVKVWRDRFPEMSASEETAIEDACQMNFSSKEHTPPL
ncbi:hypothetical protein ANCCAN_18102 [Ancylostoma caninum]|uniref:Uncharacterized protein n=1 Tax=Ancylostoma caninum TaxID=29170 RepID=A0A368FUZ3_ANCCA|nr:hypothetical protein ANCCAN_18102 [Ancylostoma caninum]